MQTTIEFRDGTKTVTEDVFPEIDPDMGEVVMNDDPRVMPKPIDLELIHRIVIDL